MLRMLLIDFLVIDFSFEVKLFSYYQFFIVMFDVIEIDFKFVYYD
jgi:hypothetical protein